MDYFDVSLVDGYNLPLLVVPQGGSGQNCTSTGCVVDLNDSCPSELKVTSTEGESVACKSACEAFGSPQYCCNGAYSTPDTCRPSTVHLIPAGLLRILRFLRTLVHALTAMLTMIRLVPSLVPPLITKLPSAPPLTPGKIIFHCCQFSQR